MRALARRRSVLLVLGVIVISTPPDALAYRPFVSTDAAVADRGEVEIEFGYAGFRRTDGHTAIVAPTVIANIGLGRGLEAVAEFKLVNDLSRGDERDQTRVEDSALSLTEIRREGVHPHDGAAPSLARGSSA